MPRIKRLADPIETAILLIIKERIEELGIEVTALAKQIGTNRQHLYRVLKGESAMSVGRLYRLARALRVRSMGSFFDLLAARAPMFPTREEVEPMLGRNLTRELDAHGRTLITVYRQLNAPNRAKIRRDMRRLAAKQNRGPQGVGTHRPKSEDDEEEA